MAVSTSDGRYYENEEDYHRERVFGPPQPKVEGDNKMYMVRHGDTACNEDDEVHGWVDQPLNEKGIEQAHKTAESLKDKEITRIRSSDLPRAKQTANILAKELGIDDIEFDPRLRTWDAGDFDYTKNHKEFEAYTKPSLKHFEDTFARRFQGEPQRLPLQIPGEDFTDSATGAHGTSTHVKEHGVYPTLKDDKVRPKFPVYKGGGSMLTTPYYPDAENSYGEMTILPHPLESK